jgi:hypothetical protein
MKSTVKKPGSAQLARQLTAARKQIEKLKQDLNYERRKHAPTLEELFEHGSEYVGILVTPTFWCADDVNDSFEEAVKDNAIYPGSPVRGLEGIRLALQNAAKACDCTSFKGGEKLRAHVSVGGFEFDLNRFGHELPAKN